MPWGYERTWAAKNHTLRFPLQQTAFLSSSSWFCNVALNKAACQCGGRPRTACPIISNKKWFLGYQIITMLIMTLLISLVKVLCKIYWMLRMKNWISTFLFYLGWPKSSSKHELCCNTAGIWTFELFLPTAVQIMERFYLNVSTLCNLWLIFYIWFVFTIFSPAHVSVIPTDKKTFLCSK